jgi:hypothetical protein
VDRKQHTQIREFRSSRPGAKRPDTTLCVRPPGATYPGLIHAPTAITPMEQHLRAGFRAQLTANPHLVCRMCPRRPLSCARMAVRGSLSKDRELVNTSHPRNKLSHELQNSAQRDITRQRKPTSPLSSTNSGSECPNRTEFVAPGIQSRLRTRYLSLTLSATRPARQTDPFERAAADNRRWSDPL